MPGLAPADGGVAGGGVADGGVAGAGVVGLAPVDVVGAAGDGVGAGPDPACGGVVSGLELGEECASFCCGAGAAEPPMGTVRDPAVSPDPAPCDTDGGEV